MSKTFLIIRDIKRYKKLTFYKYCAMFLAASILTLGILSVSYSEKVNKGLADSVIRLHVIANSDSDIDQALKRDVRDKVIIYMKDQLKSSKSADTSSDIISRNLEEISKIAKMEINKQGFSYNVKAVLGDFPFPTKSYGDITLPSGNYKALRVVIGKGEGANWWCVLFPPLCFVDATHGTVPDKVKQDLKSVLTDDEYEIITSADNDKDIPIKIRFKIVDFLQDSKVKFTGMLSRIFQTTGSKE